MVLQQTAGELIPELERYQLPLIAAGVSGVIVAATAAALTGDATQFYQSYLIGYMLCLGVTLGCLALGMMHQLTGGAWGVVLRRPIGAAARVLPLLTLLFLPILLGMSHLYIWTHADVVAADEVLQHKRLYLNTPFFIARAALYFLVWNGISYFLNRWSLEQDRTGDPSIPRQMQRLSAAGLVLYGLTITFASFDWLMSIQPEWFSTIYGVLIIGGQGLSAIAFLILAIAWLSRRPPLNDIIVADHFHDAGNLTLAFVMLWAYFAFSQYLIIWAGNLPREILWYQHRLQTGWRAIGILLVVFHFAVPFFVLLSRRVKRQAVTLAPLAAIWLGCFIWQLRGRAIFPVYDPEFDETLGPLVERATHES